MVLRDRTFAGRGLRFRGLLRFGRLFGLLLFCPLLVCLLLLCCGGGEDGRRVFWLLRGRRLSSLPLRRDRATLLASGSAVIPGGERGVHLCLCGRRLSLLPLRRYRTARLASGLAGGRARRGSARIGSLCCAVLANRTAAGVGWFLFRSFCFRHRAVRVEGFMWCVVRGAWCVAVRMRICAHIFGQRSCLFGGGDHGGFI